MSALGLAGATGQAVADVGTVLLAALVLYVTYGALAALLGGPLERAVEMT